MMPKNPHSDVWETYGGVVSHASGQIPPPTGGASKDDAGRNSDDSDDSDDSD